MRDLGAGWYVVIIGGLAAAYIGLLIVAKHRSGTCSHHGGGNMALGRCWLAAVLAVTMAATTAPSLAHADELLWARRSAYFGEQTAIWVGHDGELYCTSCDVSNHGRIPILRDPAVNKDAISVFTPWMSTLWVVLLREDQGNSCAKGEWYAISLESHRLERVNTDAFRCDDLDVSVAEQGLEMVITMSNKAGKTIVRRVK